MTYWVTKMSSSSSIRVKGFRSALGGMRRLLPKAASRPMEILQKGAQMAADRVNGTDRHADRRARAEDVAMKQQR